ncbi:AAA family ATPase [Patescibacteria group bacterium]
MSKLIIIRGYSGTGKSTISKLIAEKNDYALLREDTFFFAFNPHKKHDKKDYEVTFDNILDCVQNYMEKGQKIIIEGALAPIVEANPLDIKQFAKLAKKYNYDFIRLLFIADEKVCYKRMKKRGHIVKKEIYKKLIKKINQLKSKDEIVIDTSKGSIEQNVKKVEKIIK